jgi:DNA-binding transcriptional MerR regulator
MKNTYSIGDTAKMTGASQKQIRSWEDKGIIPKASRIVCGDRAYRRFSHAEINIIKSIKNYLDQGYKLSMAAQKSTGVDYQGGLHNA